MNSQLATDIAEAIEKAIDEKFWCEPKKHDELVEVIAGVLRQFQEGKQE